MTQQGECWFLPHQSAQDPCERHVEWPETSWSTKHIAQEIGSWDSSGELAASSHTRAKMAVSKAGWRSKGREGTEVGKQSMTVKSRFKYMVNLCQVVSLQATILQPPPNYLSSAPNQRGSCLKVPVLNKRLLRVRTSRLWSCFS